MNNAVILLLLTLAATLEAGGDALARTALHSQAIPLIRFALFAAAALVLFTYGVTVNLPPWDFGRLLGVYVCLFFLVAQIINLLAFNTRPTTPILVGGTLILAGGMLMTFWRE
jgi:drug/metabolite transporter superfamily protein YnfA